MDRYRKKLEYLQESGRQRKFIPLSGRNGCRIYDHGRCLINMSSNDYLGLAADTSLRLRFYENLGAGVDEEFALGAASSRLLTGDYPLAHDLEEFLALSYGKDKCLLFNSGYHANIGILPALASKNDLICSDKLNHASIHDGLRLAGCSHKRFRHCDYDQLYQILKNNRKLYDKVFIVSESVFSMDGDVADLHQLVRLKEEFDCILYLDEAHGVGLYGKNGLGKAEEFGVVQNVDLLVGTFGKAYGSIGAYLLCHRNIYDYLVNHSRSLIFTTALPPVVLRWNRFAVEKALSLSGERKKLADLSLLLRNKLQEHGLQTDGETNIVPVLIGPDKLTMDLAEKMRAKGYLILGVRPPTVPEGTSRFRLSLTADMQWEDIKELPALIAGAMS